jgi:hypothetical protein
MKKVTIIEEEPAVVIKQEPVIVVEKEVVVVEKEREPITITTVTN